jgi:NarL family two-component system response regulator LiaR
MSARPEPRISPSSAPRVVVVAGDPTRRAATRAGLQDGGIVVIAEADSDRDAVDLCAHFRPDVVLLDVVVPGTDGIAATRAIAERAPGVAILLLTRTLDEELAIIGLRAGASGHLVKEAPMPDLVDAVRRTAAGEPVLSPGVARRLIERMRAAPDAGLGVRPVRSELTGREWEVLDLLCAGLSVDGIADRLVLSRETVRTHVKHVLRKLGAHSQPEAIRIAHAMRAWYAPERAPVGTAPPAEPGQ